MSASRPFRLGTTLIERRDLVKQILGAGYGKATEPAKTAILEEMRAQEEPVFRVMLRLAKKALDRGADFTSQIIVAAAVDLIEEGRA